MAGAARAARWLREQSNYGGGFHSTQDTVVALEALAQMWLQWGRGSTSGLNLDLSWPGGARGRAGGTQVTLNPGLEPLERELQVLRQFRLLSPPNATCRALHLDVAITGPILYHDEEYEDYEDYEEEAEPKEGEEPTEGAEPAGGAEPKEGTLSPVSVWDARKRRRRSTRDPAHEVAFLVCFWRSPEVALTGMVVVEISLLSGFSPHRSDLDKLRDVVDHWISHYELDGNRLVLYLDEHSPCISVFHLVTQISPERQCLSFGATQDIAVGHMQPAMAAIYDYYEPGQRCTVFYNAPLRSSTIATLCSPEMCECAQGFERVQSFRKSDGSYGAWLHRDSSTWLTALVLRVLALSRPYLPVASSGPAASLRWVLRQQRPDGAFREHRAVVHREMQGGVADPGPEAMVSLTAFVVVALHGARTLLPPDSPELPLLDKSLSRASKFLRGRVERLGTYGTAITSYALALVDTAPPGPHPAVERLRRMARSAHGQRCTVFYNAPLRSSTIATLCSPEMCECAQGGCPRAQRRTQEVTADDRHDFACYSPRVDYALVVRVLSQSEIGAFVGFETEIKEVLLGEVVVLSSAGAIREALARRWGDFVGRPHSYLASLVSRGGQDLALGDVSPEWRRQRGATRGALSRAVRHLEPLLEQQGWLLCQELSSYGAAPVDLFETFAFHSCSTICRLTFGDLMPPEAEVRSFTRCVVELVEVWGRASVRALDVLPLLRALPNPGLRELLRLVERRDAFVETQIRWHQVGTWGHEGVGGERSPKRVTHMSSQGCASPPVDTVLGMLLGGDPAVPMGPLGGDRLHMALVDLFIGGTETTAAALLWAVAFLLHHPQVQDRVRAELHQVLGPTGTPKPGDMGRLPLLRATVTETLRLRPPAPLALPHCARRCSSIAGTPVPAGSIVIPNLYAAHHDPEIWDRPDEFLPGKCGFTP
ncbi:UNVERIFIED_CONTAM: hypothetical protein H355_002488 [Colinus virginianus]|nr:hypothetical protein H355_002488 [Colinus virginianus]